MSPPFVADEKKSTGDTMENGQASPNHKLKSQKNKCKFDPIPQKRIKIDYEILTSPKYEEEKTVTKENGTVLRRSKRKNSDVSDELQDKMPSNLKNGHKERGFKRILLEEHDLYLIPENIIGNVDKVFETEDQLKKKQVPTFAEKINEFQKAEYDNENERKDKANDISVSVDKNHQTDSSESTCVEDENDLTHTQRSVMFIDDNLDNEHTIKLLNNEEFSDVGLGQTDISDKSHTTTNSLISVQGVGKNCHNSYESHITDSKDITFNNRSGIAENLNNEIYLNASMSVEDISELITMQASDINIDENLNNKCIVKLLDIKTSCDAFLDQSYMGVNKADTTNSLSNVEDSEDSCSAKIYASDITKSKDVAVNNENGVEIYVAANIAADHQIDTNESTSGEVESDLLTVQENNIKMNESLNKDKIKLLSNEISPDKGLDQLHGDNIPDTIISSLIATEGAEESCASHTSNSKDMAVKCTNRKGEKNDTAVNIAQNPQTDSNKNVVCAEDENDLATIQENDINTDEHSNKDNKEKVLGNQVSYDKNLYQSDIGNNKASKIINSLISVQDADKNSRAKSCAPHISYSKEITFNIENGRNGTEKDIEQNVAQKDQTDSKESMYAEDENESITTPKELNMNENRTKDDKVKLCNEVSHDISLDQLYVDINKANAIINSLINVQCTEESCSVKRCTPDSTNSKDVAFNNENGKNGEENDCINIVENSPIDSTQNISEDESDLVTIQGNDKNMGENLSLVHRTKLADNDVPFDISSDQLNVSIKKSDRITNTSTSVQDTEENCRPVDRCAPGNFNSKDLSLSAKNDENTSELSEKENLAHEMNISSDSNQCYNTVINYPNEKDVMKNNMNEKEFQITNSSITAQTNNINTEYSTSEESDKKHTKLDLLKEHNEVCTQSEEISVQNGTVTDNDSETFFGKENLDAKRQKLKLLYMSALDYEKENSANSTKIVKQNNEINNDSLTDIYGDSKYLHNHTEQERSEIFKHDKNDVNKVDDQEETSLKNSIKNEKTFLEIEDCWFDDSSRHSKDDEIIGINNEDGCSKEENSTLSFDDDEGCDMDDDFSLTASQLNMIESNEKGHFKDSNEAKTNSYQQTDTCSFTHFGLDSVTVEVIDQLCYIRESVESIKEVLNALVKQNEDKTKSLTNVQL